jgi:hypothetical protein
MHWLGASYRYRKVSNYGTGAIRRFVSVGAPFRGSEWADLLSKVDYDTLMLAAVALGNRHGMALLSDLGSRTLAARTMSAKGKGVPKVNWFPMAGIAWPDKTIPDLLGAGEIVQLVETCIPTLLVQYGTGEAIAGAYGFTQQNSDWIVLETSALNLKWWARLPAWFAPVPNTTHDDETSSPTVGEALMRSLDFFEDPQPDNPAVRPGYMYFLPSL